MVPILLDLGAEYFHWQGKAYHFLVSFQIALGNHFAQLHDAFSGDDQQFFLWRQVEGFEVNET